MTVRLDGGTGTQCLTLSGRPFELYRVIPRPPHEVLKPLKLLLDGESEDDRVQAGVGSESYFLACEGGSFACDGCKRKVRRMAGEER